MADNKKKTGKADRGKVAGGQGYEVSYLAKKHGITPADAATLIGLHGNDRATLDAAAETLKKGR